MISHAAGPWRRDGEWAAGHGRVAGV